MSSNIKDTLTTIIGILQFVIVNVMQYVNSLQPGQAFNWGVFALSLLAGVTAYFIGKNPNLSTKSEGQVETQNSQAKP